MDNWSTIPKNKGHDLTVDDYKLILEPFANRPFRLFHCGNYGDAVASPTFNETFSYSLTYPQMQIVLFTNGSLRSPKWWKALAEEGGKNLRVTFSVDGIGATNSLYRVGSNWDVILKNMQAYIQAGGWAKWDFIEFAHNTHQQDEARELAAKLGFKVFNLKKTARFATHGQKEMSVKSGDRLADVAENSNLDDFQEITRTYGSFSEYVDQTPISCKSINEKKVFIDHQMRLWPCCWTAAPNYFQKENIETKALASLQRAYGSSFNCLRTHGWKVLEHEFFQSYLEKSWSKEETKHGRIHACGRTCGTDFEYSSGYGKNKSFERL